MLLQYSLKGNLTKFPPLASVSASKVSDFCLFGFVAVDVPFSPIYFYYLPNVCYYVSYRVVTFFLKTSPNFRIMLGICRRFAQPNLAFMHWINPYFTRFPLPRYMRIFFPPEIRIKGGGTGPLYY